MVLQGLSLIPVAPLVLGEPPHGGGGLVHINVVAALPFNTRHIIC